MPDTAFPSQGPEALQAPIVAALRRVVERVWQPPWSSDRMSASATQFMGG